MKRQRGLLALIAGVVGVVFLSFVISRASRGGTPPNKLAVIFIEMTNNPTRTMGPPRVEVCQGATGNCALFLVTNITKKEYLWFKTAFAEQKVGTAWKQLNPGTNAWSGIEGSLWMPGYGCFMAVGWPPGLPTNATWRLRVRYGKDPSGLGIIINQKLAEPALGRDLFQSSKAANAVTSSEVVP
jgi:hypothetical protein